MSRFAVVISGPAQRVIEAAYQRLTQSTPENAVTWYKRLNDAIISLEDLPERWPVVYDRDLAGEEARVMLYGSKQHA